MVLALSLYVCGKVGLSVGIKAGALRPRELLPFSVLSCVRPDHL